MDAWTTPLHWSGACLTPEVLLSMTCHLCWGSGNSGRNLFVKSRGIRFKLGQSVLKELILFDREKPGSRLTPSSSHGPKAKNRHGGYIAPPVSHNTCHLN